ncbi:Ger(x)C family spore germination protein [Paenibacillus sp. P36]|uniref:Ger(x)C family spore germination protein n=1 Tax=Paenibacillus sp. P36 TaxID=3342538 RepID=UPI0038B3DDCB
MRTIKTILLPLLLIALLTGCWDQNLLVENKIINNISFDLEKENTIQSAVTALNLSAKGGGQFAIKPSVYTAQASNLADIVDRLSKQGTGKMDISKTSMIFLGESLAAEDIYPFLERIFRTPTSNLGAKVTVIKGKAIDALQAHKQQQLDIYSDSILRLINESERRDGLPRETVSTLLTHMTEPGDDFILPYSALEEDKLIHIHGGALFHHRIMTGKISLRQIKVLSYLLPHRYAINYSVQMTELDPNKIKQFVNVKLDSIRRNMNLRVVDKTAQASIQVSIKAEILQYPFFSPPTEQRIHDIEEAMEDQLVNEMKEVIAVVQKANNDCLNIAERLAAFYPDFWKSVNWDELYPKIEIEPTVTVKIMSNGIMK